MVSICQVLYWVKRKKITKSIDICIGKKFCQKVIGIVTNKYLVVLRITSC